MNLRFVEAFYWVVTFKSFTRAAEKLYLTQSAISSRITALEEEVGTLLIDRKEKQVKLTSAGLRFLKHAERLLEIQRIVRSELNASHVLTDTLRIGVIESVLHSWLIPLITHLRQAYPELEFELTVETTPMLVEHMQRGALDLIWSTMPVATPGFRTRALPAFDMVFVRQRKRGVSKSMSLEQIAQHELLTFQRGSQPYVALLDLLKDRGHQPVKLHSVSSISAMLKLLQGGFGIATLPRLAAENFLNTYSLQIIECDQHLPPLPVHASYRIDPDSDALKHVAISAIDFAVASSGG